MTPKEAFRRIDISLSDYLGEGLINERKMISQALTELEELKRYPTSEEVCEALSEYLGRDVTYNDGTFELVYDDYTLFICECSKNNVAIGMTLPPHLITLIGRFYENEVKGE